MSKTIKTGLIARLTQNALDGVPVCHNDILEVAKLIDQNSLATSNAINRIDADLRQLNERVAPAAPVEDTPTGSSGCTSQCSTSRNLVILKSRHIDPDFDIINFLGLPTKVIYSHMVH